LIFVGSQSGVVTSLERNESYATSDAPCFHLKIKIPMHRFYLPPHEARGDSLALTGREAHHALHVLRVRRDDKVTVLDGIGGKLLCQVLNCARDRVELVVSHRELAPPLPWQITLLQAVPKGKIIESLIQKATELGVARIVPLLSERVAIRLADESASQKSGKWRGIAIEAIKQCGLAWLPKVEPPISPADFLARQEKFDLSLIASLQPGSRHAREYFSAFRKRHNRSPDTVCVWVGPEGDFTPAEVAAAESVGTQPITLGPLVLRSETAAIYCLSILNYELNAPEKC
jgi:16S rRNA (uracil1498-N3)-methyltransferase